MKRHFYKIILAWTMTLLGLSALATQAPVPLSPDLALIKNRGSLIVAFFNGASPPLFVQDAQGNWSGLYVDLAQGIAQTLGVKLVIKPAESYDAMVEMVANHQVDLAMGLDVTSERQLRISFTHPYYVYHPHLLVNQLQAAHRGWNGPNIITHMQQSSDTLKLGVIENGAGVPASNEEFPHATLVPYSTPLASMQDVAAGKIFAATDMSPTELAYFLQQYPRAALLTEDVPDPNRVVMTGIGLAWQGFHLRTWLDVYLTYLQENNLLNPLLQPLGSTAS